MSGLGRRFAPDPRDWQAYPHLVAAGLDATPLPKSHTWSARRLPLDQGNSSRCVGYSSRGLLYAGPVINAGGPSADTIYAEAQKRDEWPGENYDGTSARGAMKYLQEQGYVSAYVWASDVPTIERWVALKGPMLIGINWYDSFDNATPMNQTLTLPSAAQIRGGHEILVIGVDTVKRRFRLINSWGKSYGMNGRCWMPYDVLHRLLQEDGDAVTPTEVLHD